LPAKRFRTREAGADIVRRRHDGWACGAIRRLLDENKFENIRDHLLTRRNLLRIYGPFGSGATAPQFGDRRSYQMDPSNAREA